LWTGYLQSRWFRNLACPTQNVPSCSSIVTPVQVDLDFMATYYFIRHGESEANRDGWLAGHRDTPLTARGVEQAEEAAHAVAQLPIERVLVSDLERAVRTADLVTRGMSLQVARTAALRERSGGSWEGQPLDELRSAGHLKAIRRWYARPPAGESLNDIALRAAGALSETNGHENILVVAHGALIRAVIHALDQGPGGEISDFRPGNCEIVPRTVEPSVWTALRERLRSAHEP